MRPSSTLSASLVRVLALDYGSARCGCALSDPTGTLATPIDVVERPATRRGFARVVDLVRDRGAERVVVGLPLGLSGADTAQTREARAFADRLAAAVANEVNHAREAPPRGGALDRVDRRRQRSGRVRERAAAACTAVIQGKHAHEAR